MSTFWMASWVVIIAGTIFAMWLGERITEKGVGNGISLLIMIGIIANFPQAFFPRSCYTIKSLRRRLDKVLN
jgi:preprotein translocase subunit SecY